MGTRCLSSLWLLSGFCLDPGQRPRWRSRAAPPQVWGLPGDPPDPLSWALSGVHRLFGALRAPVLYKEEVDPQDGTSQSMAGFIFREVEPGWLPQFPWLERLWVGSSAGLSPESKSRVPVGPHPGPLPGHGGSQGPEMTHGPASLPPALPGTASLVSGFSVVQARLSCHFCPPLSLPTSAPLCEFPISLMSSSLFCLLGGQHPAVFRAKCRLLSQDS